MKEGVEKDHHQPRRPSLSTAISVLLPAVVVAVVVEARGERA
jgi:hypothetical protein